jgi:predicted PurR-regulated permease PerM
MLIFKTLSGHSENEHFQVNSLENLERTIKSALVNQDQYTNEEIEMISNLREFKAWVQEKKQPAWRFKKRYIVALVLLLSIGITVAVVLCMNNKEKSGATAEQPVGQWNAQLQEQLQTVTHELAQLSQRVETAITENTQAINQQQQTFAQETQARHQEVETLQNKFRLFLGEFDHIMQNIENDEQTIRNSESFIDRFIPSSINVSNIGSMLTVASEVIAVGQQLTGNGNNNNQSGPYQGSTVAVERCLRVGLL